MTHKIMLNIPDSAFSILRESPDDFARELLLAALSKWYEQGRISQSKGAEIANLSRQEFLETLKRYNVSPFQTTKEQLDVEQRLI